MNELKKITNFEEINEIFHRNHLISCWTNFHQICNGEPDRSKYEEEMGFLKPRPMSLIAFSLDAFKTGHKLKTGHKQLFELGNNYYLIKTIEINREYLHVIHAFN